jgi:hypothetical protein
MVFALQNIIVRSRRRLRVLFTEPVAAGAFATAFYTVQSLDGIGIDPVVNGALVVLDSPQVVELSLAIDIADGARYQLNVASGVPALAGGTAAAGQYQFAAPSAPAAPSPELAIDDLLNDVYGNDIVHNGADFVETAEGDLAMIGGPENVYSALSVRAILEGLAWDATIGARLREFVDGPNQEIGVVRSRIVAQVLQDDRVVAARGSYTTSENGEAFVDVSVTLVGQTAPRTISLPVS